MTFLLLCLSASPAHAGYADHPVRHLGVQVGLGNHFGVLGARTMVRVDEHLAAAAGIGIRGASVAALYFPVDPLFVQVGLSPLLFQDTFVDSLYGPDASVGLDLTRTGFSLTASVGAAWITPRIPTYVFDFGIGMNFS